MSCLRTILLLAAALLANTAQAVEVPYLTGRVTDNAEILNAETRKALTEQLAAHERATTNQVAVLTVPTIGDASIEEYALEVFNSWKLGRKDKDNGVLVVIAPTERRLRIEVGYGLEGMLTDAQAARIIRDVMTPRFKDGDFNQGVADGVRAVIATLEGDTAALPPAPKTASRDTAGENRHDSFFDGPDLSWPERILIGAFIFGIIGLFTFVGLMTPGMGWFLYFFLIPFWAMFPIVVLGVTGALYTFGTYLVGFPILKLFISRQDWYQKAAQNLKTKGSARIGGWTLGGGSSGSSWSSGGSSSSGGGFSGGGGRSGGGGASGSW
jgi:uncharacterized protein